MTTPEPDMFALACVRSAEMSVSFLYELLCGIFCWHGVAAEPGSSSSFTRLRLAAVAVPLCRGRRDRTRVDIITGTLCSLVRAGVALRSVDGRTVRLESGSEQLSPAACLWPRAAWWCPTSAT